MRDLQQPAFSSASWRVTEQTRCHAKQAMPNGPERWKSQWKPGIKNPWFQCQGFVHTVSIRSCIEVSSLLLRTWNVVYLWRHFNFNNLTGNVLKSFTELIAWQLNKLVLQHVTASTLSPATSVAVLDQDASSLSNTSSVAIHKSLAQISNKQTASPSEKHEPTKISLSSKTAHWTQLKLPKISHKVQLQQSMRSSVWDAKASPWCWTPTWMSSSWTPDWCIFPDTGTNMTSYSSLQVFHHFWESHR